MNLQAPGAAVAAPTPLLAADADHSGNDSIVVGAIDTCREVTASQSFQVDFVFKGAPPMFNAEFDLHYDGTILQIDSQDAATVTTLFLTKEGSSSIFDFTDSGPDTDGLFHIGIVDFGLTGPSDDGAVVRLNITALATGTSPLTIANPLMVDVNGNDVTAQFTFANSEIRVDTACPAVTGHFNTAYSTDLNTTAAAGSGNSRADFGLPSASTPPGVSTAVTFSPPGITVTPGSTIPIGKIVGSVSNSLFVGVLNSDCFNPFVSTFALRNASTDIRDPIAPMPAGTFNGLGNLRQDVRGATPGSAPNGIPDYLDAYPSFLNPMFDPDDSDVSGNSPTFPLRPMARYAGDTNIAGTDIIIQFLVFGREALTQFANAGASHPWQQFTDDFGYASVMVFQDPTRTAAPATITDLCAPFSSTTALSATTDPEVGLTSSQCDDGDDDEDNYPETATQDTDSLTNDGCPRIGVAETGAECLNAIDDGEDAPADGAINDGCPANTAGTAENPQCANAIDDDSDAGGEVNDGCPQAGSAAESGGQCGTDTNDDDGDGFVNDGCPPVGGSEDQGQCANATNDDAGEDGIVNDGCPQVAPLSETGEQCDNATDDDSDGGFVNDGCPVAPGSVSESPALFTPQCSGGADDDADLIANDGCPQIGAAPETVAQCAGDSVTTLSAAIDDTVMTIPVVSTTGFPSSGTIQILSEIISYTGTTGTSFTGATRGALTAAAHAVNDQVSEAIDDDLDGAINDGCATVGSHAVALNPPAGTGLFRTNTHLYLSFNISHRDADGDGLANNIDTCPFTADNDGDTFDEGPGAPDTTPWDPSSPTHAAGQDDDGDKIPAGCDANNASGGTDVDGDGVLNTLDNCPQVANTSQLESESRTALATAAPDGGPATDSIGDACDGVVVSGNALGLGDKFVADGHYHATFHKIAVCFDPGVDTDGDGWCDATETILGSVNGASTPAGESGPQCANDRDDDWDNFNNDGCPANTVGASESDCAAGEALPLDDDIDGIVNDGCPTNAAGTPEGATFNSGPCAGNADDDGDTIVNDGCPAGGPPETGDECANAIDDDAPADGAVNDGCPTALASVAETGAQCANPADSEDNYPTTTSIVPDGLVNDGCPAAPASVPETGAQCLSGLSATDDEDNYAPAPGIQLDGLINDGCPGVSTPEHVAVDYQLPISNPGALRLAALTSREGDGSTSGGQCASSASFVGVDDDGDGVVNDGCVAVSTAENPQCAAAENTSDDSGDDSVVNDGCPTNVFAEDDPENPCTGGTGDCGTAAACTNSIDDDNDPFINDGCPQVGVISEDQGQCSDDGDDDADNNANDGCPIVNNGVPQTCSDGIDNDGDGNIDQADTGCAAALTPDVDADGICNSAAAVVGKCILPPEAGAECRGAADDETDGVVNDGCRALTTTAGTAETVAQCRGNADDDDGGGGPVNDGCGALTTTGGTAETVGTQCNNAVDDDSDGAVNDGCAQQGARAEVGLQCNNATDDDVADSDGFVNDGCPALTTGGTAETLAQCNNAVDDDSDGFVNDGCPALTFTAGTAETAGAQCNNAVDDDSDGFVNDGCAATGVDNCPTQRNPSQTNTDAALNAAGAGVDIKGLTNFTDLPADSLGNACDPDDDNDSFTGDHAVLTGGVRSGVCRSSGLGGPVSRPVFDDCVEQYLGTDPQDNCPDNASGEAGLADALDDDAWPVDINRGGGSFDKVNTGDTLAGGFGGMQTDQNLRADFNTDLSVNLFDFFLLIQLGDLGDGFFLRSCR